MSERFRSGFVGILGRPNVGKSTLLNRACGHKLAIISAKPQTTRNRIMGVVHRAGSQIVFIDTPGMHERGKALNRYMQDVITGVARDVDVALYMVDVTRSHGREDNLALDVLPSEGNTPVLLVLNKIDRADSGVVQDRRDLVSASYPFEGVYPVSALTGEGIPDLLDAIAGLLPEGPPYFPEDMVTDQPLDFRLSEIVREKLFEVTDEEVPYATAVVVEDVSTREDGLMSISAIVYVERETQKGIVIGKGGRMLRRLGTEARQEMERRLGKKVYLDLWVKVKKGWTDRENLLRQLGYR